MVFLQTFDMFFQNRFRQKVVLFQNRILREAFDIVLIANEGDLGKCFHSGFFETLFEGLDSFPYLFRIIVEEI